MRSGGIMKLLTDSEIKQAIDNNPTAPLIAGIPTKEWLTKDSPNQPCSLDVRIGCIQIPAEDNDRGVLTVSKPGSEHVLVTGATAILTTSEILNMPANIAAIGFPPSHVSIRGLLMTNPGHVDPGYHGPMHFTVINMSRSPFALRIGDAICTVLFFQLDNPVSADWRSRAAPSPRAVPPTSVDEQQVNLLGNDFVDFRNRATTIANDAVGRAQWRATWVASAISLGFLLISQFLPYYLGGFEDLKTNFAVSKTQVENLEKRIAVLEAKEGSTVPTQPQAHAARGPSSK
jgi:deoxycytidine triphosphate deaminase